jgi:hypothetical protein
MTVATHGSGQNGAMVLVGQPNTPASGVTAYMIDGNGYVMYATGTTVPSDAGAGYAKGCLFVDTDVAGGTTGLYVNVGTTASCNFDAVSDA